MINNLANLLYPLIYPYQSLTFNNFYREKTMINSTLSTFPQRTRDYSDILFNE